MTTPADQPLPDEPFPGVAPSDAPLSREPLPDEPAMSTSPHGAASGNALPHNASDEFDVDLEQAHDGPLKAAARWVVGLVDAALGGDGSDVMGATAVVRRIDNDAEILRVTGYNIDEAEGLVALLRKDLAELTRGEFLEKWGAKDGVETSL